MIENWTLRHIIVPMVGGALIGSWTNGIFAMLCWIIVFVLAWEVFCEYFLDIDES